MSNIIWYDLNKTEHLAHYGVKGMKWGKRKLKDYEVNRIRQKRQKSLHFSNDTDAYRYDKNNKWFENAVATTDFPEKSGRYVQINETYTPKGKPDTQVHVYETAGDSIRRGKEAVEKVLHSIGGYVLDILNAFKKK